MATLLKYKKGLKRPTLAWNEFAIRYNVTGICPLERQAPIHMVPVPSQELPERYCIQPRTALGTPAPDFSSGLTPEAFPMSGYGCKAAEV